MKRETRDKRLDRIVRWFTVNLLNYEEIGARLGLTRERVRQLLAMRGLAGKDGGGHVRRLRTKAEREKAYATRFIKRFGMPRIEYRAIFKRDGGQAVIRFKNFRRQMKRRYPDKPFALRFGDWWKLWEASGLYNKYGRRIGHYVMVRKNLAGGFSPSNMKIISTSEHSSITIRRTRRAWGNDLRRCRQQKGRRKGRSITQRH